MEASYAFRKHPWLDACQVAPEICEQVIPRLSTFRKPFGTGCHGAAAVQHAKISVCGLLSDVERTHSASLADRFGPSRLPLQGGMGWDAWDDAPWRDALRSPVKTPVGQGDGGLMCDPSGLPTAGRESVGVARPGCGRLGQVDHGPVALALGDVSRKGHPRVDPRLYRPQAWTQEKARLDKAGVPTAARASRTRHPLAWARLEKTGAALAASGEGRRRRDGATVWVSASPCCCG
jgi:SRSO17 transposase